MKSFNTFIFLIRFYILYLVVRLTTIFAIIINLRNRPLKASKDILYLEVFTSDGAGYNYRVKLWMDIFKKKGLKTDSALLIENSVDFFQQIKPSNFSDFIMRTGWIRFRQILNVRNYDIIIVRRCVVLYNDYGNMFMEKLLYAIHPNIILDIDDDLGATHSQNPKTRSFANKLLMYNQLHFYNSFKFYKGFIVGSKYLGRLVLNKSESHNESDVCYIPTCVDYNNYEPKIYQLSKERLCFGWIGGNHNLSYLKDIIPALNEISKSFDIKLIVIAGVDNYDFNAIFPVEFKQYSLNTEIVHLKEIDIGLMPMPDTVITRAKCGFKLIQYMGLGIPSVASAIGENMEIIDDNQNGWLVYNIEDWEKTLKKALCFKNSLLEIGLLARNKIEAKYSFKAHSQKYLGYLKKLKS